MLQLYAYQSPWKKWAQWWCFPPAILGSKIQDDSLKYLNIFFRSLKSAQSPWPSWLKGASRDNLLGILICPYKIRSCTGHQEGQIWQNTIQRYCPSLDMLWNCLLLSGLLDAPLFNSTFPWRAFYILFIIGLFRHCLTFFVFFVSNYVI